MKHVFKGSRRPLEATLLATFDGFYTSNPAESFILTNTTAETLRFIGQTHGPTHASWGDSEGGLFNDEEEKHRDRAPFDMRGEVPLPINDYSENLDGSEFDDSDDDSESGVKINPAKRIKGNPQFNLDIGGYQNHGVSVSEEEVVKGRPTKPVEQETEEGLYDGFKKKTY